MILADEKILVTGGGGFVGSNVIKKLISRGVAPGNISSPNFKEADLRDPDTCQKITKDRSLVIHLAGTTGDIKFHLENPGSIFFDNLLMGVHLMEAARLNGVKKFVCIGSATEYPASTPIPFEEKNIWGGYPEKAHAPYSLAKKMLLVQAQSYRAQYGFNSIHLLPTNMYGPGENLKNSFVIPMLTQKILRAKSQNLPNVEVWGSGQPTRDFLYIEDAVEGILLAAEKYDQGDPVNLGSGMEISIKNLVELICRLVDYKGEVSWDTSKPDGQPRRLLSVEKAQELFGFRAATPLEVGLKKTLDWYTTNLSLNK